MSEETAEHKIAVMCEPPGNGGMSLDQYQRLALETALFPTDKNLSYLTLALCGEVGEVAEKVKKVMRDKGGQFYAPDMAAIALDGKTQLN